MHDEVWGYDLRSEESRECSVVPYKAKNGEYLFEISEKGKVRVLHFFSGKVEVGNRSLRGASKIKAAKTFESRSHTIQVWDEEAPKGCSKNNLWSSYITVDGKKRSKSYLVIASHSPRQYFFDQDKKCPDYGKGHMEQYLDSIAEYIIGLEDGTYIVYNSKIPVMVRMTDEMLTGFDSMTHITLSDGRALKRKSAVILERISEIFQDIQPLGLALQEEFMYYFTNVKIMNTNMKEISFTFSPLRFTGGDELEGFEKLAHEVLQLHPQQRRPYDYSIPYSRSDKRTVYFGWQQIKSFGAKDENPLLSSDLLLDIATNAKDALGNRILSAEEIKSIPWDDLYSAYGDNIKIIQMLRSEYGIRMINKSYQAFLRSKVEKVKNFVSALGYEQNKKAILGSEEMLARILDYEMCFGIQRGDELWRYLNGEQVTLPILSYAEDLDSSGNRHLLRAKKKLHLRDTVTGADIKRFIRATNWYANYYIGMYGFAPFSTGLGDFSPNPTIEEHIARIDALFGIKPDDLSNYTEFDITEGSGTLDLGDAKPSSIKANGEYFYVTTTINVDLRRLMSCIATLNFDDHAILTINGKQVFKSIDDGGEYFSVINLDGKNWVMTGASVVPAETMKNSFVKLDMLPHLKDGVNELNMRVIVEGYGNRHIGISYENKERTISRL